MRSLVLVCFALAGCDGSGEWSELRDALTLGRGDVLALARVTEPAFAPIVLDAGALGVEAVRVVDRARAEAGADALVAARYTTHAERLVASDCGPLFVDGALDLAGWRARCGATDARPTPIAGLPTLVAWLPDEGRLLVHPRLARAEVGLKRAALVEAGPDCLADLEQRCVACADPTSAGCEPLFGPGTPPVACPSNDAPGGWDPTQWRERYCAWRAVEISPHARFRLLEAAFVPTGVPTACWDPTVRVSDLDSLLLAMPWTASGCPAAVTRAQQDVDNELPVPTGAPWNTRTSPYSPWPLLDCARWMDEVVCGACTPDPEAVCSGLFEQSSASVDCHDLRRADSGGGGFAAWCAHAYGLPVDLRQCVNHYERCYEERFDRLEAVSYDHLVAVLPGFFDPRTRDHCISQWQACLDGDPLHGGIDVDRPVPTAPLEPTNAGAGQEGKCPQ